MTKTTISHPSSFISSDDALALRSLAARAEELGQLDPHQLALIYRRKWFNLFVAPEHGGLGLSLVDGLRIEEGLAWVDGSLGWTVTLCSGANWFIRFLDPCLAAEVFADPRVCLCGSGRPSGVAVQLPGGAYEITGYWKYATGAPHATAFTANCRIEKDGVPLQNKDGSPLVHAFLFRASEVHIHEDWLATGMIATASHSFSVDKLRVPASRSFIIGADAGFQSFAEATLAVNSSGMAARFLDLAAGHFSFVSTEPSPTADPSLVTGPPPITGPSSVAGRRSRSERSSNLLLAMREHLQTARDEFYAVIRNSAAASPLIGAVSRELAATSLRVVDELYPWCGLAAARPGTEINRVWRDIHTASQHGLLLY